MGNAWFTQTNLSLSTLKSVTTRYKFCCFLLTKRTGKLYPVKPLRIIPSFSNLSISFCIIGFWSSRILYVLTKKGLSSHSFNFTSKYGHVPISSLMLNAAVFSSISFIRRSFSAADKMLLSNGTFRHNISSSVIFHLGSSESNHGYGSLLLLVSTACLLGV